MSTRPKILCLGTTEEADQQLPAAVRDSFEVVRASGAMEALASLSRDDFAAVFTGSEPLGDALQLGRLIQNQRILDGMPDGVVLLDSNNQVIWGNKQFRRWCVVDSLA